MCFFYFLAFDRCKGHTNILTKIRQMTGHVNIPIGKDQNLGYFVHFCLLAFDLCKGHINFFPKFRQIISQGIVPSSLDQILVYFVAISSGLYCPCSLCLLGLLQTISSQVFMQFRDLGFFNPQTCV